MVLNFKWSKMQSLQMSQVNRIRMILNFLDITLSKLRHINNNLLVLNISLNILTKGDVSQIRMPNKKMNFVVYQAFVIVCPSVRLGLTMVKFLVLVSAASLNGRIHSKVK